MLERILKALIIVNQEYILVNLAVTRREALKFKALGIVKHDRALNGRHALRIGDSEQFKL